MNLTTRQAAEVAGMSPNAFRREVIRALRRGVEMKTPESEWPDLRTPLYDAEKVKAWNESRTKRTKPADTATEAPR